MSTRPPNKKAGAEDPLLYYETRKTRKCNCCCICCTITAVTIVILLLLAFLLIFVGFPLIFKKSPNLQRDLIFPTSKVLPANPEFSNFKKYNISGARNIYVTVNQDKRISLGVWHLLPHALLNDFVNSEQHDYSNLLAKADFPILLHFHDAYSNRIHAKNMYNILRRFFHVIAFDYRGYGDSSSIPPTEEGIVEDSLEIYKWVRAQTNADIYFWGHELGAALSTHTILKLHNEDIVTGLFLEAPFTNIKDQIQHNPLIKKLFSWMPWFKSTMMDPLEVNGFLLKTSEYIRKVDCPIMIIHAYDDEITPISLGLKVFKSAQERDQTQGEATWHPLPDKLGYGHYSIYRVPELPDYIRNHTKLCMEYKRRRE